MKHHFIHMFRHPSVHPSCHGLFISMGWRKNGIQTRHKGENNRKKWHTCQSPTIISNHQKLSQLQKELTPSLVAFLPFLPFRFLAFARKALASSSSFSSISFQILASSRLADSFASLLASSSSVKRYCFNLFDSSFLSYIHEMQSTHL